MSEQMSQVNSDMSLEQKVYALRNEFKSVIDTEALSVSSFDEIMLSLVYLNNQKGSNIQKLTMKRTANSQLLYEFGGSYPKDSSDRLPVIQMFRLLFDTSLLFYASYSEHKAELASLIKEVMGESRVHLTIDSSKHLPIFGKCRSYFVEVDNDLEEAEVLKHETLLEELCKRAKNGWETVEKETSDEALEKLSEDALADLRIMNDWYKQFNTLLARKVSVYASLGEDTSSYLAAIQNKLKACVCYEKDNKLTICGLFTLTNNESDRKVLNKEHEKYKVWLASVLIDICYQIIDASFNRSRLVTLRRLEKCKSLSPISICTVEWGIV